jgi:hypothetical protein
MTAPDRISIELNFQVYTLSRVINDYVVSFKESPTSKINGNPKNPKQIENITLKMMGICALFLVNDSITNGRRIKVFSSEQMSMTKRPEAVFNSRISFFLRGVSGSESGRTLSL